MALLCWGTPTYAGELLPPGCPLHSLDFGPSSLQCSFDWVRYRPHMGATGGCTLHVNSPGHAALMQLAAS